MDKNLEVILTIGLPASGKSTWAKEYIKKNPRFIRINRDDFRYMLKDSGFCEPNIEKLITEICDQTILKCLAKKQNIILDNTHLRVRYINDIINLVSDFADVKFILFDTSVEKCIERDKNREKAVGENIIRKMNKDFITLKQTFHFQDVKQNQLKKIIKPDFINKNNLPNAVCFDVDGTIALMGKRYAFDWDRVDFDSVNEIVAEHIKFHKNLGRTIIILSGRDSKCKTLTEEWLKFYNIEYDYIFMRQENDNRRDSIIKKELYEQNIKDKFNVLCVYDDRIQVVKMWYELGVFCFNVNQGNIEF